MQNHNYNIWWGPPRKFTERLRERKISWLELFFDLVYAIVISRTTHGLAVDTTPAGMLDYAYLIVIIFWGWYNGSQYHDLHGSGGIRTRFMTLWQMMIVAALAVTLNSPADKILSRATIAIAVLQFYITYLWWSVGLYDKNHRKYNLPYTICFLAALGLIILTLFIPQPYKRILFWVTVALNFIPPFISSKILKRHQEDFSLSSSMIERLGAFTIIVFGEAILGVINGMNNFTDLSMVEWVCFGLGILIVFALWWIFFALIADHDSVGGLAEGSVVVLIYIITLGSLGMIGACFPGVMLELKASASDHLSLSRIFYGGSVSFFLLSIVSISQFLVYPHEYHSIKPRYQGILVTMAVISLCITFLLPSLSLQAYLLCIFALLFVIIVFMTNRWFRIELQRMQKSEQ